MSVVKELWAIIMKLSLIAKILLLVAVASILVFMVLNFLVSSFKIANIIILVVTVVCIIACFIVDTVSKK